MTDIGARSRQADGMVVAKSVIWGMVADGFRPDRWDVAGATVSLLGVGLIMYAPH